MRTTKIAYIADPSEWSKWTVEQRNEMAGWLHGFGVVSTDVAANDSIVVYAHPDGDLELSLWVYERNEEGRLTNCDTCPCCARQKRVRVPVEEPVPSVFGARLAASLVAS